MTTHSAAMIHPSGFIVWFRSLERRQTDRCEGAKERQRNHGYGPQKSFRGRCRDKPHFTFRTCGRRHADTASIHVHVPVGHRRNGNLRGV